MTAGSLALKRAPHSTQGILPKPCKALRTLQIALHQAGLHARPRAQHQAVLNFASCTSKVFESLHLVLWVHHGAITLLWLPAVQPTQHSLTLAPAWQGNAYLLAYNSALTLGWCAAPGLPAPDGHFSCDRTRKTVVTRRWAGLCRGYVLFLTVKEVAAGGWSKEVYEVGVPHQWRWAQHRAPAAAACASPCQRSYGSEVQFATWGLCRGETERRFPVLRRRPPCR